MGIMRAARGWGKGEPRSKKENALQQAVSHRTWPIRSKPFLGSVGSRDSPFRWPNALGFDISFLLR